VIAGLIPVTAAGAITLTTTAAAGRYFSDEFTEVNLESRVVPMLLTATRITMLRPTAIRQYSIAVAPDWSARNLENRRRIQNSCRRSTGFSRAIASDGT
jgi:hypothetical protein